MEKSRLFDKLPFLKYAFCDATENAQVPDPPLLNQIQAPMGRMELIGWLPNKASVYVDYAHTPDGLENVLPLPSIRSGSA